MMVKSIWKAICPSGLDETKSNIILATMSDMEMNVMTIMRISKSCVTISESRQKSRKNEVV